MREYGKILLLQQVHESDCSSWQKNWYKSHRMVKRNARGNWGNRDREAWMPSSRHNIQILYSSSMPINWNLVEGNCYIHANMICYDKINHFLREICCRKGWRTKVIWREMSTLMAIVWLQHSLGKMDIQHSKRLLFHRRFSKLAGSNITEASMASNYAWKSPTLWSSSSLAVLSAAWYTYSALYAGSLSDSMRWPRCMMKMYECGGWIHLHLLLHKIHYL